MKNFENVNWTEAKKITNRSLQNIERVKFKCY